VANFAAVCFRRRTPQITNPGGLWDEDLNFYPRFGGNPHLRGLAQYMMRPEELPAGVEPPWPISVTFIPASVFDNPAPLRVNPEYLAWLLSLPLLERKRLLGGGL
jgi:hypothetical protein